MPILSNRRRQESNLRSQRETDFQSVALTARPRLLTFLHGITYKCSTADFTYICLYIMDISDNGIVVSMVAFQEVDPGSNSGHRSNQLIFILNKSKSQNSMESLFYIPYCLVVRIPGSHPGGPGSIPGMGSSSSNSKCILLLQSILGSCYSRSSKVQYFFGCRC